MPYFCHCWTRCLGFLISQIRLVTWCAIVNGMSFVQIGSAFNLTNTESNAQLGNASTVVSVAIRQHGLVRPQSTSVASFETGSNQTSTPVSGTNPAERAWVMVFDDDPALLADRLSVDSVATVSSLTYTDQNGSAFHRLLCLVCHFCSCLFQKEVGIGISSTVIWSSAF